MSHERHGRTHSHPVQDRAGLSRLAGLWWMFLLTGIAWLILSWVALRFNPASVPTVGVLLGVSFLVAMLSEFFIAAVLPSWRWLHVVIGVIFAFGAGRAFARPENAFWTLASILGLLLIFRGTLDIITSASTREVNSAWWLGMVAGILEVLLGFWASQQYLPVRGALMLIWVGFFALFRGISEIVIAFEFRRAQHPQPGCPRRQSRVPGPASSAASTPRPPSESTRASATGRSATRGRSA